MDPEFEADVDLEEAYREYEKQMQEEQQQWEEEYGNSR
tara:strand:- start:6783 stop:6896 length:114 start_codon:yes stop_codon:yes gene_type:complete